MTGPDVQSSYLDHLPAVFRTDPFAGRFLLAFEAVFTGRDDVMGLEELIGSVVTHLDPMLTPPEFLPWLASWVALGLRADWDLDAQRGFLARAVSLYHLRGTAAGLAGLLHVYLQPSPSASARENVVIFDDFAEPAHFFQVQLTLSEADPVKLRRMQEIAQAIIDQEKPAHTFYALRIVIPTMRLVSEELKAKEHGVPPLLRLGRNTWLGTRTQ